MDTSFYPKLLRRESGGWRCVLTGLPCFGVSASLRCRSFHAYYDNAPQHLVHSSKRSAPLQDNPRNIPQNWPNTFNAIPLFFFIVQFPNIGAFWQTLNSTESTSAHPIHPKPPPILPDRCPLYAVVPSYHSEHLQAGVRSTLKRVFPNLPIVPSK